MIYTTLGLLARLADEGGELCKTSFKNARHDQYFISQTSIYVNANAAKAAIERQYVKTNGLGGYVITEAGRQALARLRAGAQLRDLKPERRS